MLFHFSIITCVFKGHDHCLVRPDFEDMRHILITTGLNFFSPFILGGRGGGGVRDKGKKVKYAYKPNGPSGQSVSKFQ